MSAWRRSGRVAGGKGLSLGALTGKRSWRDEGFTLLEVLASLMVLSAATAIYIMLYSGSLSLAESGRSQKAAALVAEEHLTEILNHPAAYQWPDGRIQEPGKTYPLVPVAKEAPPNAMPTDERQFEREKNFYERFTWEVHARLPSVDANYFEVIVVVTWREDGRERYFTLTSCVPRTRAEGRV